MNNYMNLDDLVCEGYDIILEASTEYNNLCIAMMKLEHKAIMNEDSNLLNEGIKDFGYKVSETIKKAWERFKLFLDKTITSMKIILIKITKSTVIKKIKNFDTNLKIDLNKFVVEKRFEKFIKIMGKDNGISSNILDKIIDPTKIFPSGAKVTTINAINIDDKNKNLDKYIKILDDVNNDSTNNNFYENLTIEYIKENFNKYYGLIKVSTIKKILQNIDIFLEKDYDEYIKKLKKYRKDIEHEYQFLNAQERLSNSDAKPFFNVIKKVNQLIITINKTVKACLSFVKNISWWINFVNTDKDAYNFMKQYN